MTPDKMNWQLRARLRTIRTSFRGVTVAPPGTRRRTTDEPTDGPTDGHMERTHEWKDRRTDGRRDRIMATSMTDHGTEGRTNGRAGGHTCSSGASASCCCCSFIGKLDVGSGGMWTEPPQTITRAMRDAAFTSRSLPRCPVTNSTNSCAHNACGGGCGRAKNVGHSSEG